jgi:hypothetical protein
LTCTAAGENRGIGITAEIPCDSVGKTALAKVPDVHYQFYSVVKFRPLLKLSSGETLLLQTWGRQTVSAEQRAIILPTTKKENKGILPRIK